MCTLCRIFITKYLDVYLSKPIQYLLGAYVRYLEKYSRSDCRKHFIIIIMTNYLRF